jgi:predicted RNA-binding protein with PIN domain
MMSWMYLIDGFNVLHADPRLERLLAVEGPAAACRALVQLVTAWLSTPGRRRTVVLVFDGRRPLGAGRPGPGPAPGMTVLYMEDEADAELMRRLRQARGRGVLVSADREVAAVAEATGSETLAPRAFLARVHEDLEDARDEGGRDRHVPPQEVKAWLKAFKAQPPSAAKPVPRPRPTPEPAPAPAPKRYVPRKTDKDGGPLSADEVQAWKEFFDGPPDPL